MRCSSTDVPLLDANGKLVSAHMLRRGLLTSLGCRKSLLSVYMLNQRISDDIEVLMLFGSGQITSHGRDLSTVSTREYQISEIVLDKPSDFNKNFLQSVAYTCL